MPRGTVRRPAKPEVRAILFRRLLRLRGNPALCEPLSRRILRGRFFAAMPFEMPVRLVSGRPALEEVRRAMLGGRILRRGRGQRLRCPLHCLRLLIRQPLDAKVCFGLPAQSLPGPRRQTLRRNLLGRPVRRRHVVKWAESLCADLSEQVLRRIDHEEMLENVPFRQVRRPDFRALHDELRGRVLRRSHDGTVLACLL